MATANIDVVGPGEYGLIRSLYNQIFAPSVEETFFSRRLGHRNNALMMVAELEKQPVGFSCGYELRPSTYYSWLSGVIKSARRMGVATQLLSAEHEWAKEKGYEMARFECYNKHKAMIMLATQTGYDIAGTRYDSHMAGNLVIFEKNLQDTQPNEEL